MQFERTYFVVIDNTMSMYDGLHYVTCRIFLERSGGNIVYGVDRNGVSLMVVLYKCWILIGLCALCCLEWACVGSVMKSLFDVLFVVENIVIFIICIDLFNIRMNVFNIHIKVFNIRLNIFDVEFIWNFIEIYGNFSRNQWIFCLI